MELFLIGFFSCLCIAFIILGLCLMSSQKEKHEKKEKAKEVYKDYEEQKKENESIINSATPDNTIELLHNLADKGKKRLNK